MSSNPVLPLILHLLSSPDGSCPLTLSSSPSSPFTDDTSAVSTAIASLEDNKVLQAPAAPAHLLNRDLSLHRPHPYPLVTTPLWPTERGSGSPGRHLPPLQLPFHAHRLHCQQSMGRLFGCRRLPPQSLPWRELLPPVRASIPLRFPVSPRTPVATYNDNNCWGRGWDFPLF